MNPISNKEIKRLRDYFDLNQVEYDYQRLQAQTFADYLVVLNISYEQERARIKEEVMG